MYNTGLDERLFHIWGGGGVNHTQKISFLYFFFINRDIVERQMHGGNDEWWNKFEKRNIFFHNFRVTTLPTTWQTENFMISAFKLTRLRTHIGDLLRDWRAFRKGKKKNRTIFFSAYEILLAATCDRRACHIFFFICYSKFCWKQSFWFLVWLCWKSALTLKKNFKYMLLLCMD